MLLNHLKIAFRSFLRYKRYTLTSFVGLVVGMITAGLILMHVAYEYSYDKTPRHAESIYRVAFSFVTESKVSSFATNFLPIAPRLKEQFPEVEDYNRILYLDRHATVRYGEKAFQQNSVIYSDPSFFSFFSIPLIQGDSTVLKNPHTVALSKSTAKKYFGDENPIGKVITLSEEFNSLDLYVTGLYEDIAQNNHIKPLMVVSLKSIEFNADTKSNEWSWPIYLNYIRLKPQANPEQLASQFSRFSSDHFPKRSNNAKIDLFLQPFTSIHLNSHLQYEIEENGNSTLIYILLFVAILILMVAYINYINLTIAQALQRSKEVGIRKVMGSSTFQLTRQFLTEAGIWNILALLVTLLIIDASAQTLETYTQVNFSLTGFILPASLFLVGIILSSLYPAVILSSIRPINALKGNSLPKSGNSVLRRSLVAFQFTITIALLINALIIYQQINYLQTQNIGVDIKPILVVNAPRMQHDKDSMMSLHEDPFCTLVKRLPFVRQASVSSSVPGVWISKANGIYRIGNDEDKNLTYQTLGVDHHFTSTYNFSFIAGRNFSPEIQSDERSIVITERAMNQLGFENADQALGEEVVMGTQTKKIIGVVKNYNHSSSRDPFSPIILYLEKGHQEYFSIQLDLTSSTTLPDVIKAIERQWEETYRSNPFEYSFLEETYQRQYDSDRKFGKIFNFFTLVAIVLSCLGFIALTAFSNLKRAKEVGIRKVLGSTTNQIVFLFVKDIGKQLLLAALIALPLAYWVVNSWITQFTFRIALSWWMFLVPVLTVSIIALLSVAYQLIQASKANPIQILRQNNS